MKEKEKRMILTIILVGVIIIAALLMWKNARNNDEKEILPQEDKVEEKYVEVLEDGTKLNKSNKLNQTKKVGELEVAGIQLAHSNGTSVILATVTNRSNQNTELTVVEVTLYDDKKNKLETVEGLIEPLKPGASTQLNMGVSADYANAYDFTIIKK